MPGFELFGDEERREVAEVLETGILMRYGFDGPRKGRWKSRELERALADRLGVRHALLTSSGTGALTTALAGLGVGQGDEVIMPTFTFVATFEAILSVGAVPVPVDVDDTLTLDPAAVRAALTPATRAIMPVHMCGAMADMDALSGISDEHGLLLLEDACQSLGATYNSRALGTIGDAGVLSFDFVKTVTCGEGGAVLTDDTDVYTRCDGFTDHGHDHQGVDRGADDHPNMGFNFRISELHAAVGLAQLRKLDRMLDIQRARKRVLEDALSDIDAVTFRRLPDPGGDSATFLSFFVPDVDQARMVAKAIKAAGQPAFHWFDNNWHYIRKWTHFESGYAAYASGAFSASDAWMDRCISIPVSLLWSDEDARAKAGLIRDAITDAC